MNNNSMKSNIWKYYIYSFFSQFMFFIPVIVLFFKENGLSMTQILLLQSLYAITIVVLEIPTGAIGDYFGKKTSISIGAFAFTIGLLTYSLGYNFYIFLIAELFCAIGGSLISGSDSALIHSSLKQLNREKDYKKIEGNATSITFTGVLFAGIFGSMIGNYSLRATMFASTISIFLGFLVALTFKEPKVKVKEEEQESFKELILNSIKIVRNHKLILWIFFYSSLILGIAHILNWFYQPYFQLVNIPIIYFGWIYGLLGIVPIIASRYTHQIEKFFGNKGSLLFLSTIIIISSLSLGLITSVFAISFFAIHQLFAAISRTIFNDRVLNIVSSSKAATILSINNLGRRFFYAIFGPIFGYITDTFSLQTSLISLAITVLIITIIMFFIYGFIPEQFLNNKSRAP